MNKPDDIPQDVWDDAERRLGDRFLLGARDAAVEIIARAIMAERERCAKVAEDYDGPGLEYGMDYQLGDASRTIYDISTAIRAGTK